MWGTRNTDLYGLTGGLSRALYVCVLRGVVEPSLTQKKIEFGISGDAISNYNHATMDHYTSS